MTDRQTDKAAGPPAGSGKAACCESWIMRRGGGTGENRGVSPLEKVRQDFLHGEAGEAARRRGATLAWSILGLVPFGLVYLAHAVSLSERATGFILWDMPYYCANGREVFERGNGVLYCNPYDPSPDAPVIYFHWLPALLGFGITVLGVDPGAWFLAVGAIAAVAAGACTLELVASVLPSRRFLVPLYLLAMWGGGLLVIAAIGANLLTGRPPLEDPIRLDPFRGWWFLSWGRNLVLPNEAVHHLLVAIAWLAIARKRSWPAVWAVVLLAATHPFSGIQHLAILGAWFIRESLAHRRALPQLAVIVAATLCFLGYYFIYLPAFPGHRAIHERWTLDWTLPLVSLAAAYGPVAVLAALRVGQDRRRLPDDAVFFLIAAGVSLVLVKHEWFLPPRQPLHFTRGYVWMPLFLVAAPLLQRWLLRTSGSGVWRRALAAVLAGVFCGDTVGWIGETTLGGNRQEIEVGLSKPLREAFEFLDAQGRDGVVLVTNLVPSKIPQANNYLARTYTRMIPLLGHPHLTADFEKLRDAVERWEETGAMSPAIERVDILIVSGIAAGSAPWIRPADWRLLYSNEDVAVLERRRERPR